MPTLTIGAQKRIWDDWMPKNQAPHLPKIVARVGRSACTFKSRVEVGSLKDHLGANLSHLFAILDAFHGLLHHAIARSRRQTRRTHAPRRSIAAVLQDRELCA